MKLDFDVVIIGCGVAGMSSAIYLKRAGFSCLLVENEAPGGQVLKSSIIENYPGIISIQGPDLAFQMYEQIKQMGIPYRYGNVLEIKDFGEYKEVITDIEVIKCKAVIIASGRRPKGLSLPLEDKLMNHGISYCAFCDGTFFKEKDVIVVGGGNSAIEEAIYLSNICKKVTIVHRNNKFTADKILIDKLIKKKNVKIKWNKEIISYLEKDNSLVGVMLKDNITNKVRKQKADGVFLFVGHLPNTSFVKDLNLTDKFGYLLVDEGKRCKIPFIYAAGDVVKKDLFQIVTATSDGAIAASSFIKDISKQEK